MKLVKHIIISLLLFLIILPNFAERKENIDVYLVLDRSLSMIEEIDAVKEYVNKSVISEMLIPGDNLTVITFYGKAEDAISFQKIDENNKQSLQQKITKIDALGKFTDIGNALDELRRNLVKQNSDRQKYILLITDGKQEAPGTSKYYSPDGKFNHEFIKAVKETKEMTGWKIMVLGIGKNTISKDLANEFSGNYTETSDNPTKEDIEKATKNFWTNIDLQGDVKIKSIPKDGNTKIIINVLNKDSDQPKSITIDNIKLTVGEQSQDKLIDKHFIFIAEPNKPATIEIPVKIKMDLKSGANIGEISFTFFGDSGFNPSTKTVTFNVNGFIANNIWIIPIAILLLLAIILLIIYIVYLVSTTKYFKILSTNVTLNKSSFGLRQGQYLYVTDSKIGFDITGKRDKQAFARISSYKFGINVMSLENKRVLGFDKLPQNILNNSVDFKKQDGDIATLKFIK